MTDTAALSGAFDTIPHLRIIIDGAPRGTIETRDWERWDPQGPFTNWWWIVLRRDDRVWVEDSCGVELSAPTLELLEARTQAAVHTLLGYPGPALRFEALKADVLDPEPAEAEEGSTSETFRQVDELCSQAILAALGE